LSALGLLLADVRKDYSRTLLVDAARPNSKLKTAFKELHRQGDTELAVEGFQKTEIQARDFVDLRYRGQSYELTVPFASGFVEIFHKNHERRYGYSSPGMDVELVNVRTVFVGVRPKPKFVKAARQRGKAVADSSRSVWIDGKQMKTRIYNREKLGCGHHIDGPAIIGEYSSTTLVPPDFRCTIDEYLNLVLET